MDNEALAIARRTGAHLAGTYGPSLPAFVERELQHPGALSDRYIGVEATVAVGALIVSVAQLAWQIFQDLRKDNAEASPEALGRRLRLHITLPAGLTAEDRDRVIEVVVAEVIAPGA